MHPELLNEIVALCKRRQAQGDHPTELIADAEVLENAIVQLSASVNVRGPMTLTLQADALQWRRECEDGDELLRLLGLDPEEYRTDGGSVNMPKVRETVARWRSTGAQGKGET